MKESVTIGKNKRRYLVWLSVIAILAVATFVYFANDDGMTKEQRHVYFQTKDALELLSVSLNKGVYSVHYIKEYDKAKNKVFIQNDSISSQ
jgi:hypothetical protein